MERGIRLYTWMIRRKDWDEAGHDEARGFLLVARSRYRARQVAAENRREEAAEIWTEPTKSDLLLLGDKPSILPREEIILLVDGLDG